MKNIFRKRKECALKDEGGFTLIEGVITSSIVLALATGTGIITYSSIQNNQKQETTNVASSNGYNQALSNLSDFDKSNDSIEDIEEILNNNDEGFAYNVNGSSKDNLCVTSFYEESPNGAFVNEADGKKYKFSSTSGSCDTPEEPRTFVEPTISDTVTRVNLTCDVETTGRAPFQNIKDGSKASLKGDDGTSVTVPNIIEGTVNFEKENSGDITLKEGVSYTLSFDGKYSVFDFTLNSKLKDCVTSFPKIGHDSGINNIANVGGKKFTTIFGELPKSILRLDYTFRDAVIFEGAAFDKNGNPNSSIANWDTSNIGNLDYTFYNAKKFNLNINNWKVNKVNSMIATFQNAEAFNQPLNNWNTGSVKYFMSTFANAKSFNQPLDNWDTSSANNLRNMFSSAKSFNQDINSWDVRNVTDLTATFSSTDKFDSPLNAWELNSLKYLSSTFDSAIAFDQPLDNWNTSKVTHMNSTFKDAKLFDQDISNWETENVTTMQSMFNRASAYSKPVTDWKTHNVKDMSYMFNETKFNHPVNHFKTHNVTSMEYMFHTTPFNQSVSNFDTSKVTSMARMFASTPFNQSVQHFNVSNVKKLTGMFWNNYNFNQPIKGQILNSEGFVIEEGWDTSEVVDMSNMFRGAAVFQGDISGWNTSKVTSMYHMFSGATVFNSDISNWDVRNVKSFAGIFRDTKNFNQEVGKWTTSSLTGDLSQAFYGATAFNKSINNWDVTNATNFKHLFYGATSFNKPLNNWGDKVKNVHTMESSFENTSSFKQNLSNWNLDNYNAKPTSASHKTVFKGSAIPENYKPLKFKQ